MFFSSIVSSLINDCVMQLSTHEVVEVCGKILYQVELARNTLDIMWGFSVEAELVENSEKQVNVIWRLCVFF